MTTVPLPIVIPCATGPVFAPVKAHVNGDLWEHLPEEFLDSAVLNNHESESLLRMMPESNSITLTLVGNCGDNVIPHPVVPRNSVSLKIQNGLLPILFDTYIDWFEEHAAKFFRMSALY